MTTDRKKERLRADLGLFMRQYKRKACKNGPDPNDRQYDRKLEQRIKRMKPEELDDLLNQ
jgi:hypothetical protein